MSEDITVKVLILRVYMYLDKSILLESGDWCN